MAKRQPNKAEATSAAQAQGFAVSRERKSAPSDARGLAVRNITVGNAVAWYDPATGGCACWQVTYGPWTFRAGYIGEAIRAAAWVQS